MERFYPIGTKLSAIGYRLSVFSFRLGDKWVRFEARGIGFHLFVLRGKNGFVLRFSIGVLRAAASDAIELVDGGFVIARGVSSRAQKEAPDVGVHAHAVQSLGEGEVAILLVCDFRRPAADGFTWCWESTYFWPRCMLARNMPDSRRAARSTD